MFEDLDDPSPDLRPHEALPSVKARGRLLRRRRRVSVGAAATAGLALVTGLVLSLPGGQARTERLVTPPAVTTSVPTTPPPAPSSTPPTTAPTPTVSPGGARTPTSPPTSAPRTRVPVTPSAAAPVPPPRAAASPPPSASPTRAAGPGVLELRGDDLGVTSRGAARAVAVAAVTAVLGPPVADPSDTVACVNAQQEVAWAGFRLAFDSAGAVSGWVSTSPALRTPSGTAVGSTVSALKRTYGQRLRLFPSDGESGDTYTVQGVQMLGVLSGVADTDRVVSLRNGDCTGP